MSSCPCPTDDYYIDQIVCRPNEMHDNEIRLVHFDDDQTLHALLIKQNDEFRAIGTRCPHRGAPLAQGALGDGRLRCPWHGACFRLRSGDIEDFPGLDSIPSYPVTVEKGRVKIRALRSQLEANRRVAPMLRRVAANERCIVLLGGGPSAGICAETLRQEAAGAFTGRIVMVCLEEEMPYDRVQVRDIFKTHYEPRAYLKQPLKVTKAMDSTAESLAYRTAAFYRDHGIEILLNTAATRVDCQARIVHLNNGQQLAWNMLYIATGSEAIRPQIPGVQHPMVCLLRTRRDASYVHRQLLAAGPRVVVCWGTSFVALEAAAYCVTRCKSVTVVGRDETPLRRSYGALVGERIKRFLMTAGVRFVRGAVEECVIRDGALTAIRVAGAVPEIECDLFIVGLGARPNTGFLKDSGLQINANGTIDVDEHQSTTVAHVYAGGDVANAPLAAGGGQRASIGHYGIAQYHGRIAAFNMTGMQKSSHAVPYFWTSLLGKSFRFAGWPAAGELVRRTQIVGSLEELRFVAIYWDADGQVIAMASCAHDPVVSKYAEILAKGKRLTEEDLAGNPLGWMDVVL